MRDFSPEELAHLDQLWQEPERTIREIRTLMQQKFSVRYTEEELHAAAQRDGKPDVKVMPAIAWQPRPRVWKPVQIKDTQCKARVPAGSFPVPEGGYRLLSGRS